MTNLYKQIGGREAVTAAVDIFYNKVLGDERIKHFFTSLDMKDQRRKQILFLTYAFGGPNNYDARGMREAHAKLVERGLNGEHFNAVVEHLGATLQELNVPADLVTMAASIAESTRTDVLGR
jgi:hemoglobin